MCRWVRPLHRCGHVAWVPKLVEFSCERNPGKKDRGCKKGLVEQPLSALIYGKCFEILVLAAHIKTRLLEADREAEREVERLKQATSNHGQQPRIVNHGQQPVNHRQQPQPSAHGPELSILIDTCQPKILMDAHRQQILSGQSNIQTS